MRRGCRCSTATRRRARCIGCGCESPGPNINGSSSSITIRVAAARSPTALIEGCSGYLQSDGYQAYEGVTQRAGLIHVGCFAHARRRFFEALKALPNAQRKQDTRGARGGAAHRCAVPDRTADQGSRATRGAHESAAKKPCRCSHPCTSGRPKCSTRRCLQANSARRSGYLITQWPKLVRYVEDPRSRDRYEPGGKRDPTFCSRAPELVIR